MRAQLERLHDLKFNFDPARLPAMACDAWHVDSYRHSLPPESPGEPVRDGQFETAKLLLCD